MPPDPSDEMQRADHHPGHRGAAFGWGWGGFALMVTGIAGLLFHLNEDVPVLQSHLGRISIGLIAIGAVLIVAGALVRARRGGPPPAG